MVCPGVTSHRIQFRYIVGKYLFDFFAFAAWDLGARVLCYPWRWLRSMGARLDPWGIGGVAACGNSEIICLILDCNAWFGFLFTNAACCLLRCSFALHGALMPDWAPGFPFYTYMVAALLTRMNCIALAWRVGAPIVFADTWLRSMWCMSVY